MSRLPPYTNPPRTYSPFKGGLPTPAVFGGCIPESYQPGTSVALVARRNAVNANLVFNWRRQYRERGGFVPVVVEPDRLLPPAADAGAPAASATGRIEIALADGSRVIVDREVDGTALARVLSVLARR